MKARFFVCLVLDLVSVLLNWGGDGLNDGWLLDDPCWWDSVGLGGSWDDGSWGSNWQWGSSWDASVGQWGIGVVQTGVGVASWESSWEAVVAEWESSVVEDLALSGSSDGGEDNSEGFHGGFLECFWMVRSTIKR